MGINIPGVTGSGIPPEYSVSRAEGSQAAEAHRTLRPGRSRAPDPMLPGEDLDRAAEILEQTFRLFNKRLKITVNKEIERVVVKVIDGNTDKVIKEIPPEELQKLIARIKETIGLLFDEKI
ncbi:MAG: flagellar protein FlaG [Spirochaetales bacterium]|nr:flagellar protein FlaG [Spirochaetales bacterium]